MPADGLAPYSARPLAGAVLMINLCFLPSFSGFQWFSYLCRPDDIQNCDKISWNLVTLWVLKLYSYFSPCNPIHCCYVSGHSGCCWSGQQSSGNQPKLLWGLLCTGSGQTRRQVGELEFLRTELFWWNIKIFFHFLVIYCNGRGNWNPSLCKTKIHLSCIVNSIVADDLMTGARALLAMVLTEISWNIPFSASEALIISWQPSYQWVSARRT